MERYMKIQLDMYQTMAVAVVVLMLGSYLRKKIDILERFCLFQILFFAIFAKYH